MHSPKICFFWGGICGFKDIFRHTLRFEFYVVSSTKLCFFLFELSNHILLHNVLLSFTLWKYVGGIGIIKTLHALHFEKRNVVTLSPNTVISREPIEQRNWINIYHTAAQYVLFCWSKIILNLNPSFQTV